MQKNKTSNRIDWQVVAFFALACLIAWPVAFIFGVDDEALRANYPPFTAAILIYLPKFAFSISGLVLFAYNKKLKEMWQRLTHFRVKWFWYALAYFGPALLYFLSALVSNLLAGNPPLSPQFELPSGLQMLLMNAQSGILAYFFFRGGLGEEIGLRGFALPRLQTRHTPVKASLILGFFWAFWHLPAWIERSPLELIIVWLGVMSFAMIFTWFYNHTLSLPVVMLLHAALNSFDDVFENIFPALAEMDWELPYVLSILILGIVFGFVMRNKSRREAESASS